MKKNILFIAIILIALVAIGFFIKRPNLDFSKVAVLGGGDEKGVTELSMEEAKNKASDFIANNLVAPGTDFSIKDISEESGLYKLQVDVGGQEAVSYISEDGKIFFLNALNIAETEKQNADSKQAEADQEKNIPKSDKPELDLYVMSFCPYGNKAEDTLKPVYDLLKDDVNFNFHYIVSSDGEKIDSLHGEKEVAQDEREACVLRDYGKDEWMNFATYVNTNCGSDGSCWEAGAKSLGINVSKINSCVASDGVALMKDNEKASNDAGASGSPTMIINGVETKAVYQYGDSEAYKKAICSAFNEIPEACSEVLTSNASVTEGGSCN